MISQPASRPSRRSYDAPRFRATRQCKPAISWITTQAAGAFSHHRWGSAYLVEIRLRIRAFHCGPAIVLQTSRLTCLKSITAPPLWRLLKVIEAMGWELSPRSTSRARSHVLFDRYRSNCEGSTVRKRPLATKLSRMKTEFVVTTVGGNGNFLRRNRSTIIRPAKVSGGENVHCSPIRSPRLSFFRRRSG